MLITCVVIYTILGNFEIKNRIFEYYQIYNYCNSLDNFQCKYFKGPLKQFSKFLEFITKITNFMIKPDIFDIFSVCKY